MSKRIDETGNKYGKLTVISYAGVDKSGKALWNCMCECGNKCVAEGVKLRSGRKKSCGCLEEKEKDLTGNRYGKLVVVGLLNSEQSKTTWICKCDCGNTIITHSKNLHIKGRTSCGCKSGKDLTGEKFGRLTVIKRAPNSASGHKRWFCDCDCGTKNIIVHDTSLKTGNTKSCGCYKKEEAQKRYSTVRSNDKRLYSIWNAMKQRCTNPNSAGYENYGGRGITICEEWTNNYENFYYWSIENGYDKSLSIDRIDNNKGYSPDNCRWTDIYTQANNKRNIKLYEINGETKSIPDWCRIYKVDYFMVYQRVHKLGWDIVTALTAPKQQ